MHPFIATLILQADQAASQVQALEGQLNNVAAEAGAGHPASQYPRDPPRFLYHNIQLVAGDLIQGLEGIVGGIHQRAEASKIPRL